MPFLLNYGFIDLIGSLMEPLMRPVWKVPGSGCSKCNCLFCQLILGRGTYYKQAVSSRVYTIKRGSRIDRVQCSQRWICLYGHSNRRFRRRFLAVYFSSLFLTMVISAVTVVRIPPFNKKADVYLDGKVQTAEDRRAKSLSGENVFVTGVHRMAKKSYTAKPSVIGNCFESEGW